MNARSAPQGASQVTTAKQDRPSGYRRVTPRVADRPALGAFQNTPEAEERRQMRREFMLASILDHRSRLAMAARLAAAHASVLAGRHLAAVADDLHDVVAEVTTQVVTDREVA